MTNKKAEEYTPEQIKVLDMMSKEMEEEMITTLDTMFEEEENQMYNKLAERDNAFSHYESGRSAW